MSYWVNWKLGVEPSDIDVEEIEKDLYEETDNDTGWNIEQACGLHRYNLYLFLLTVNWCFISLEHIELT